MATIKIINKLGLQMGVFALLVSVSGFNVSGISSNTESASFSLASLKTLSLNFGAHAAKKRVKDKRPKRRTPLLRSKVFKKIEAAQAAIQEKNMEEGLEILNGLKEKAVKGKLNGYEIAQMWNMYAFVYFSSEKYADAINAYENVIKQKSIPWVLEDSTIFSLAQLNFLMQNFKLSLKHIDHWLATVPNPSPQAYVFKAQIHYQMQDLGNALAFVKKGVDLADKNKRKVKESWLQLLSYLYYEKKDIDNSVIILERLVAMNPKKSFVQQLSGMYMNKDRPEDQLVLYRALYEKGVLEKEKELITLSSLYISIGVPVKAGIVMEKGIKDKIIKDSSKNMELLGNAWYRAQELEKSIVWLEKAGKDAKDGKIFMRLSATYLDLERFDKAIDAAKRALKLGGLRKEENTHIILGSAYFYKKKFESSLSAFGEVLKIDEKSKLAKQWIKYVTTEKKKQEVFKAFLAS